MNATCDRVITVRLRPDQLENLDRLARRTYRRRSDLLRMAIDGLRGLEHAAPPTPNPDRDAETAHSATQVPPP